MAKTKLYDVDWKKDVEDHDYAAARSYLSLVYDKKRIAKVLGKLKKARVAEFKAKDIFRASQLSLLGVSNSHVQRDRAKIAKGHPLSPLLLVREPILGKVIVADGYHRLCAVYQIDEDAIIHCKIV
jgi:hypothetical protein